MKNMIWIFNFSSVSYVCSWQWNKQKTENGKVKFIQEIKLDPKVIKKDFIKASLTHQWKNLNKSRCFIFLNCLSGLPWKLVPLHNLVKSEWFYVLEIWRYEQSKRAITMRGLKKLHPMAQTSRHPDGHCNSMTESAQWGRIGEKLRW